MDFYLAVYNALLNTALPDLLVAVETGGINKGDQLRVFCSGFALPDWERIIVDSGYFLGGVSSGLVAAAQLHLQLLLSFNELTAQNPGLLDMSCLSWSSCLQEYDLHQIVHLLLVFRC